MNRYREDFFFATLEKYGPLSPVTRQTLKKMITFKGYGKNEFIVSSGERKNSLFLIRSGICGIFCLDRSGNERIIDFRSDGELAGFFSPGERGRGPNASHYIRALTDCEIISLSLKSFTDYPWEEPGELDRIEKQILWEKSIRMEERVQSFLIEDAGSRYEAFIRDNPLLFEKIPLYHIASYLGISPESLSRIRASWMVRSKNRIA